jgi:hypothetical protein
LLPLNISVCQISIVSEGRYDLEKLKKFNFFALVKRNGLVFAFIILFIVFSLSSNTFLSERNIFNVLRQQAVIGIIACTVTVLLIAGKFDLSVGSILSLSAVLVVDLHEKIGPIPAILITLIVATLIGILNGFLVGVLKLNAFVITLGMLTTVSAIPFIYDEICEKFIEDSKNVIVGNPLDPAVAKESLVMGPVISQKAKNFILSMIDKGVKEGATLALDGRNIDVPGCEKGFFIGPTVFTDVKPGMEIQKVEIFGPVVVIMKADTLDEAIRIINEHEYGNGASIYTQNGYYARKFKLEAQAGMIGVNVGIPAPVAYLPFGGMKESQYADIKAQGKAIIGFYTEDKVITERYFDEIG